MATVELETHHEDLIHDVQFDYYGKLLATASSDRSIRIFNVSANGDRSVSAVLQGHSGPVWQVAWAHPKFGTILASCSYDRKVIVWQENRPGTWSIVYEYTGHGLSVNSIAWAPHEFGLCLATASSDASVSVLSSADGGNWQVTTITGVDQIGVNALSWAPVLESASLVAPVAQAPVKRFVTGGCDSKVKIYAEIDGQWRLEQTLPDEHQDWIRDVAWAPSIGLPSSTIATCSQDGTVLIWTQERPGAAWIPKLLGGKKFSQIVWRVSWSVTGNILAVSCGDNKVSLWKESLDGEWKAISTIGEDDQIAK